MGELPELKKGLLLPLKPPKVGVRCSGEELAGFVLPAIEAGEVEPARSSRLEADAVR